MKRIGIERRDYPELRNILSLADPQVEFVDCPAADRMQHPRWSAAVRASGFFRDYAYLPPVGAERTVDCFHFFNSLPLTDVPFVTTFETAVPRWWGAAEDVLEHGWRIVASPKCRQLFAISYNAKAIFLDSLRYCPAPLRDAIAKKTSITYPPQKLLGRKTATRKPADAVRLVFVGGDFLRKGGYEMVCATLAAIKQGARIALTIVSEMRPQGDPSLAWNLDATNRLAEVARMIESAGPSIAHHPRLANRDILALFARSDVAVLPSFGDTFGYAVLEAQAAGTPVITSDIRAFPEINNNGVGWICNVPLTEFGKPNLHAKNFAAASESLTAQLTKVLLDIAAAPPQTLNYMGQLAQERIAQMHDPVTIARIVHAHY